MAIQGDKIMNLEDGQVLYNDLRRRNERNAGVIEEVINTPSAVQTFDDGADNLPMALTVGVDPVQDLHGYDNPWPGGAKNKAKGYTIAELKSFTTSGTWSGDKYTLNDVTFEFDVDNFGLVTAVKTSGTASANTPLSPFYCQLTSGTEYTLTGCPSGGSSSKYELGIVTNSVLARDYGSGVSYTPSETREYYCQIIIRNGKNSDGLVFYPMVRLSSDTDDTWEPYQNICPISGWTGANVTRTGKNLCDNSQNTSGYYGANGNYNNNSYFRTSALIQVKPSTQYNAALYNSGTYVNKLFATLWDANGNFIEEKSTEVFTTTAETKYVRLRNSSSDTNVVTGNNYGYQLEEGNTHISYEPFGNTYPITFPSEAGTVYGGTLTVNKDGTGTSVVDVARTVFDGSSDENWKQTTGCFYMNMVPEYSKISQSKLKSNTYESRGLVSGAASIAGYPFSCGLISSADNNRIYVVDSRFNNATDFKAYLSSNNVELTYELAEPITIPLTAPQVKTLLGVNNIWADTGNILSVDYPADTKLYIDKKFAELSAAITALGT